MRAAPETAQDQSEPESARADRPERRIKLWVALPSANGFGTANQVAINAKTFVYGLSGCQSSCGSATSASTSAVSFGSV